MPETTEFNMSLATLIRIDQLLTSANSFKISNQIYNWFLVLLSLYTELSVFIDDKRQLIFIDKITIFSNMFSNIYTTFNNDNPYITRLDDYLELLKFEIELRQIAKDNGLLIKIKDIDDIDLF